MRADAKSRIPRLVFECPPLSDKNKEEVAKWVALFEKDSELWVKILVRLETIRRELEALDEECKFIEKTGSVKFADLFGASLHPEWAAISGLYQSADAFIRRRPPAKNDLFKGD